jgi:GAF domain-containing protein
MGRTLIEGKAVQVPDVLADPEYMYLDHQKKSGARTILGVPLLREGSPIGVVLLYRSTVRPFTDKQIELVTTFADQAVIAIENVRLFDDVQARTRELTEALEQQTATSEVLQVNSRPHVRPRGRHVGNPTSRGYCTGLRKRSRIERRHFMSVVMSLRPPIEIASTHLR